jgi:hypothetical protein
MCVVEENVSAVKEEFCCESDDIFSDIQWKSAVEYS